MAFDSYTKLMLHCNGTDGSATFTDEIGHTMTRHNQAQIDTAQSKFGGASALFDTVNDWVDGGTSSDWNLAANDFTIDFWIRWVASTNAYGLVNRWRDAAGNQGWMVYHNGTSLVFYYSTTGSAALSKTFTWNPSDSTWYHVAVVRNGNNLMAFVDGTQIGTTQDFTGVTIYNNSAVTLQIGGYDETGGASMNGWMDEIRLSNGIARWTANFTPPSSEYSGASGPANLKSYNTNVLANIKSINTNVIANVKSLDTNV